MSSIPGVRPAPGFRRIERTSRFRGRVVGVSVDRLVVPGGPETSQEVIHLPPAACVVPLLEEKRGLTAVLVEQFRNSLEGYIHEFPAGILEDGEDPRDGAARELEEETGYRAGRLTHLTSVCPLPGTSSHRMHFFMAEGLTAGRQALEEVECLEVVHVPFRSLLASVMGSSPRAEPGERVVVVDAKTHLGVLHVAMVKGLSLEMTNDE